LRFYLFAGLLALVILAAAVGRAEGPLRLGPLQVPLGTAFTYQGQLTSGGTPVNGACDFQFRLFDGPDGSGQVGPTLDRTGVQVANGFFTVQLDFGPSAFDGNARYLEVSVRCPSGTGAYTQLSPRQPVTPTPYAVYALTSGSARTLQGFPLATASPAPGQVLKFNGGQWTPADDLTGTVVSPGTGLTGTTAGITLTLAIAPTYRLPQGCAPNQAARWDGSAWVCGDAGAGYTIGPGLVLSGTELRVSFGGTGSATQVARSDHTHTAADIVTGTLSLARIPQGPGSGLNADLLDGLNSTAFALSTHDHDGRYYTKTESDGRYLSVTGTATNSARLGGFDPSYFAPVNHNHDDRYLLATGKAADADNLDGLDSTAFARSTHNHDDRYLGLTAKAADADRLDGLDSTAFALASHDHDGRYYTKAELQTAGSAQVSWSNLTGVPAGFSDGIDHDTLGALACADGQIPVWSSAAGWGCGTGGAGASYTAGPGLVLSGNQFSVNFGGTGAATTVARSDHNHDSAYWRAGGNGGLGPGGNYLGTTDNVGVTLGVSSTAALRLIPARDSDYGYSPNLVGGHISNTVGAGVIGAAIGGGGAGPGGGNPQHNAVTDRFGTVAGGMMNRAGNNDADPKNAAFATVGGGIDNIASGMASMVPGGTENRATGNFSFAAGYGANANHNGAFVWADSTGSAFSSEADNQFIARATGGVKFVTGLSPVTGVQVDPGSGTWSSASSQALKANFADVDPREVLAGVMRLPVRTWSYRAQDPSVRHMGPTAEDFRAAFGLGDSPAHIATVDADGVALAAIQGLGQTVDELRAENRALKDRLERLEDRLNAREQPGPAGGGLGAVIAALGAGIGLGFLAGRRAK
jgi:hypothetical protein